MLHCASCYYYYCRKYTRREANIQAIQLIKASIFAWIFRKNHKGVSILRDLDTNFKWWFTCFMFEWMIEKVNGRKMLGADLGKDEQGAD